MSHSISSAKISTPSPLSSPPLEGEGRVRGNFLVFILILLLSFVFSSCDRKPNPAVTQLPQTIDRIVLTNGGVIQGKVVEETAEMVRIELKDGVVGFQRNQFQSVERNISGNQKASQGDVYVPTFETEESRKNAWPPGVKHRILLTNGEWVNGQIIRKLGDTLTARQTLEEGGAIELDLSLKRIEKIELWPPPASSAENTKQLEVFRKRYPSLKPLRKDYYMILSSMDDPADLKFYLKTLDQFYHDFLLYFFDLIAVDGISEPLDVIIFGTSQEFSQALFEIGYNARSNPVGFYHFDTKRLVFYNVKTDERIQAALKKNQAFKSQMAELSSKVEKEYGPEAAEYQGQISRAQEEAARYDIRVLCEATAQNVRVIRHEGGHQLFHLLGITHLHVYSGGWLIEGLAVYCEPQLIGDIHEEKLMHLRYELEKNDLMPLEYLLNFARGTGLHKLEPSYASLAYAESWAFIYFLMHAGYHEAFASFLKEMHTQGSTYDANGEKALLEKHLGKSLKTVEPEFIAFVKKLILENTSDKTYKDFRSRLIMNN